jgi:hypothetical protein
MQNISRKHGAAVRLKQLIRNFSDDSGATTVEFVLWVPVFMFILMITVDVSLLFLRQSNLWYVARDVARQASLRQIDTTAGLIAAAQAQGTFGGDIPSAAGSNIDSGAIGGPRVEVMLSVPMNQVGIFGILKIGGRAISVGDSDSPLRAYVTMRLEPI